MRRIGVLLAPALAVALLLAGPGIHEARSAHCGPVLVFSGHKAGPARGSGVNAGAGGCVFRDENVNTNYLTPGATYIVVGTSMTPVPGTGTVVLDGGAPVPLTFAWSGTRWNSQDINLDGAQTVTATAQSVTGVTVSVTYRAVTEGVAS